MIYLLMAAGNAMHRSAHHEAAALARRGLQALAAMPDVTLRAEQEISLRLILGVSLMATHGFAAAEVEATFNGALALVTRRGASVQAFWVQWLLGLFRYFRAEMPSSHQIAEDALALATTLNDPASIMEGRRACGVVLVELGRSREALTHLEAVGALYDRDRHPSYVTIAGLDPKVVSESFAARALWALGYPDQALMRAERGLALAEELAHAPSVVLAAHFLAGIHLVRGDATRTLARAAAGVALADEYGLELWMALGHIHQGWARVEQGQVDAGIQQLQRGLAQYSATGARLWRSYFLGLLGEALGKADRADEGLAVVAEALALVRETGEAYATPELHRLQGELLIRRGSHHAANQVGQEEACFHEAIAIARRQGARSWELRAATSLGRLYQRQGRRDEARRVVGEVYDAFTEGSATADVTTAETMLSSLTRVSAAGPGD